MTDPRALSMRVVSDPKGQLDIVGADAALRTRPLQNRYDTHRQETPIWFAIETPPAEPLNGAANGSPPVSKAVMFPSRHIQQLQCFDGSTLKPIGSTSRDQASSGDLLRVGSGVALQPGRHAEVICRGIFNGPAVLEASQVSPRDLKQINDTFHRRAGLLEGGLATLAAFVLITALINRDWVYVLFAAGCLGTCGWVRSRWAGTTSGSAPPCRCSGSR